MSREPTVNRRWCAFRPLFITSVAAAFFFVAGSFNAKAAESVPFQGVTVQDLPSLWASRPLPAPEPLGAHVALESSHSDAVVLPAADIDMPPEQTSSTIAQAPATSGIAASPPFEAIIVTVTVNDVAHGTAPVLRDQEKRLFVPLTDFRTWNLAPPSGAVIRLQGVDHVALDRVPGLQARFDERRIALEITVPATELPKNTIDLRWHYPDALRPTQPSAFFNYAFTMTGDESFNSRQTQVTTEVGARIGNTLLYSSGTYRDQTGDRGYTRLQTNATYDQRDTLQRLIVGDFITPVRELSGSVPMGGLSFSKYYSMDPFLIQYPTLNLSATAALPSQVEVKIDGNVVARQQVQPGPLDIVNITGYTGARNVQVVVRDAFGREQVYQQPYYFTDFALKKGLHEYSYNLGFLRENYGIESNDYGNLAFSGFHRYGFTDQVTLGIGGQAREGMANIGPIGTVLLPNAGIIGAGVSVSEGDAGTGYVGSVFYSFTAPRYSVSANARHYSDNYRLLPSDTPPATRSFASAYGSYSLTNHGTISTSFTVTQLRGVESLRAWNVGYTVSLLGSRATLTAGYTKNSGLIDDWSANIAFRYFFGKDYSAVASAVRAGNSNGQAVSFEKTVPRGEGFGFNIGPGRVESPTGTAMLANGFAQYNGRYATLVGQYQGSSNDRVTAGIAEVSVASGIGYVPGHLFISRPLTDSFAVVKVGDVPGVPVLANGQFQGTTDKSGEVVVSPMISFSDNYLSFERRDVPLDFVFKSSQMVVSPAFRSGSYLEFDVKKNRAVLGRLERDAEGKRIPIEFRELKVTRAGADVRSWEAVYGTDYFVQSFTAKGGEFYIEQLEPGEWRLEVKDPTCVATIKVPKTEEALTDLGAVLCVPTEGKKSSKKP